MIQIHTFFYLVVFKQFLDIETCYSWSIWTPEILSYPYPPSRWSPSLALTQEKGQLAHASVPKSRALKEHPILAFMGLGSSVVKSPLGFSLVETTSPYPDDLDGINLEIFLDVQPDFTGNQPKIWDAIWKFSHIMPYKYGMSGCS